MSKDSLSNRLLLILILDRLIKNDFLDNLSTLKIEDDFWRKNSKEIKDDIEKHNNQLLDNLYLDVKEAKTANRKLQLITKLYGYKDFHPNKELEKGSEKKKRVNIQYYINKKSTKRCSNIEGLSEYFYIKLNKNVCTSKGIKVKEWTPLKTEKLKTLFDLALPNKNIETWKDFSTDLSVKSIYNDIIENLKKRDDTLSEYILFKASYYSQTYKHIRNFNIYVSKTYSDNTHEHRERAIHIHFPLDKKEYSVELNYRGKIIKEGNKLTGNLINKPDKRAILIAVSPQYLEATNVIQGVFMGDSERQLGHLFGYEFIAAREKFLKDEDNVLRISSVLLLRRSVLKIGTFDLFAPKLDKLFFDSNSIDDGLNDILTRVKKYEMLFLNYGRSKKIFLSKMQFDDRFESTFMSPIPKRNGKRTIEIKKQLCHFSARGKGRKVIITTYNEGKELLSIVTINFHNLKEQIFTGTFSYYGDVEVYTNYIVGIIDEENKKWTARELSKKDIERLKEKRIYIDGLNTLASIGKKKT